MIMSYAIYIITNTLNAKQYVGMAKNLKNRWYSHRQAKGACPVLHSAIKKYGIEYFIFTHIANAFDHESACEIERLLIIQHNSKVPFGYNLTEGGGGTFGLKKTDEIKNKIRQSNVGKNLGKTASEKTKAKMSAIHKSRPRQPLSDKVKEKIRQSLLGRKMPESEKPKHASFLGRKHTEETKAKISATNIATKAIKKAKRLEENKVML
tara:strand:+ start:650 stop:1273 length:624 start_codon:yes stop_codon:yes gene_type:complete